MNCLQPHAHFQKKNLTMKATLVSETGLGTVKRVLIETSMANSIYDQVAAMLAEMSHNYISNSSSSNYGYNLPFTLSL